VTINSELVVSVVMALVLLIITAIIVHMLTKFTKKFISREGSRVQYMSIIVNVERMIVWGISICVILGACFEVNVSGLLAALGIGGIAISLGMQDTISNLIGGIQLSVKNIVAPGDYVSIGTTVGVVKDVTWRYTVITSIYDEETIVPNSVMINQALTKRPPWNKVKAMINFPFETVEYYEKQGEGIDQLKIDIAEAVAKRLTDPAPEGLGLTIEGDVAVYLRNSGDYSYEGYVSMFIQQDEEFNRLMIEDAIVCAAAPFTCKGRG